MIYMFSKQLVSAAPKSMWFPVRTSHGAELVLMILKEHA